MESSLMKDALIPGARGDARKPIIPNITKHERKHSMGVMKELANIDNSVQGNNYSVGLNSGRDYLNHMQTNAALQNSQSRFSQMGSNGTLLNNGSQAVLGLHGKETMTFRG